MELMYFWGLLKEGQYFIKQVFELIIVDRTEYFFLKFCVERRLMFLHINKYAHEVKTFLDADPTNINLFQTNFFKIKLNFLHKLNDNTNILFNFLQLQVVNPLHMFHSQLIQIHHIFYLQQSYFTFLELTVTQRIKNYVVFRKGEV